MGVISNGLGSTNIKDGRGFMLLTVFTVPTTVVIEPFASHFFINGFITRYLLIFCGCRDKNWPIFPEICAGIQKNIDYRFGVVIVLIVILGSL